MQLSDIVSEKPNYEVGSAAKLSFGKKPTVTANKIWKLDVDDDEMIDADELLDEEDKQKPTSESLRVCSTTGKRKACKDCSCGLADELEAEAKGASIDPNPTQKSSCGSVSFNLIKPLELIHVDLNLSVLSRRCFPLFHLPLSWIARLQTRRESSAHRRLSCKKSSKIPTKFSFSLKTISTNFNYAKIFLMLIA